jgi:predicted P-loop ATPase
MPAHAYTPAEVESIARTLGGAHKTSHGWTCRCPAHEDRKASLSLSVGRDGRLLWKCHAGCDQTAVHDQLKKAGVLLNGDASRFERKPKTRTERKIVATYPYEDEQGVVLFEVVRYEPKDFRQRRPDGNSGWYWSLGDTRRVLYHLPEVLAAEQVIVVEGEKDADNLRASGFVATTSPQGADKWQPGFTENLAGKRVVILPDNDGPGRKHAEAVARSVTGNAASVKVLELDGLPPKADVSDWLKAGHTADELRELIDKAAEWQPGKPVDDEPWRALFVLDERGRARAVEHNVALILELDSAFQGRLRFNELSGAAECSGVPWRSCDGWRAWTDQDDLELARWCQIRGLPARPPTAAAAAQLVACRAQHHPVREYLDGLSWDGVPRIETWLVDYLGVELPDLRTVTEQEKERALMKRAYIVAVSRMALIQAVARAYQPGCKADAVLIIEGEQDIGKSSAIEALAADPAWFADEISDPGSKDAAQDIAGKWIVELAELSAVKRGEVERVKAFISRRVDHYRPSYGRRSTDFPRQCVFFGSTNSDAYLADETGNRRYWPVRATKVNLDGLRAVRDQLWAEAVAAYYAGSHWWMDECVRHAAREEQAARRDRDAWEPAVLAFADATTAPFTVGQVLSVALNIPVENQDKAKQMRVAGILKEHGYERKRAGGGGRGWGYVRPNPKPAKVERVGEVGTPGRDASPRPEVGTSQAGRDEVGTDKPLSNKETSQPSQPSQPFFNNINLHKTDVPAAEKHPNTRVYGLSGSRLGRWDGWDAANRLGFPAWDEPGWDELLDEAADGAAKQAVVKVWAQKAGGQVLSDGIRLPRDLPHDAAYRGLISAARRLRLRVEEGGR